MTVLAELDFDGMTDGSAISVSPPWSTAGQVPVADDVAAIHGDRGCRYSNTGSFGRVQYDTGSNQTAARVWHFYFNIGSFSSATQYMANVYSLTSGGSIEGDWRINTNQTVSIRNSGTVVATSSEQLASGTDYRAEWKVDTANDTQELRIYIGESGSASITLTGAWSSSATRVFTFGPAAAAAGGAVDYDTIKLADDWIGPESSTLTGSSTVVAGFSTIEVTPVGGTPPYDYSISQNSGTTTTPTEIADNKWLVKRHITETLTYAVTITDSGSQESAPIIAAVTPASGAITPDWPKGPIGTPPTNTWGSPGMPASPSAVGYIGDSLTYQNGAGCLANGGSGTDVLNSLTAVGFSVDTQVDGLIGRSIVDAGPTPLSQDVVENWRTDGFDPDTWVIALGSNNVGATDNQWTTYINNLLDHIADGPKDAYTVYWIGITFRPDINDDDDRSARFVSVMEDVAADRDDKITMIPIDYDSLFHNGRDETGLWLSTDGSGRHMTPTGYGVRNQVIADALTA